MQKLQQIYSTLCFVSSLKEEITKATKHSFYQLNFSEEADFWGFILKHLGHQTRHSSCYSNDNVHKCHDI